MHRHARYTHLGIAAALAALLAPAAGAYGAADAVAVQPPVPPAVVAPVESGFRQLRNLDLTAAEATFRSVISLSSNHPAGYVCLALTALVRVMSVGTTPDDERLCAQAAADAVRTGMDSLRRADDPWVRFFLGMALLLQARTCSDQGRTLEALQLVKRGLLHIERAHADAPRVTDALAVLGAYQYFASHLPWYVRTLAAFLVLPPDREQGRERLEQAAANARYCAAEARAALTTAAWWDSDAEHALGAAAALTNAFPANYHFALLAQHVMLGARRTGDALAAATHTLAVIQRDDRPAAYGMIADQQYMLGLIRIAQTNYQAALTHFGIAATVGRNKPWIQGWALLRQGMMHDVLGRREAARQCYAAACGPEYRSERLRQFARAFGARPYAGEAIE